MEEYQPSRLETLKTALLPLRKELGLFFTSLRPRFSPEWALAAGMGLVILLAVLFEAYEAQSGLGLWPDVLLSLLAAFVAFWLLLALGLAALRLLRWLLQKLPPVAVVVVTMAAAAQIWVWGDSYWVNLWLAGAVVLSGVCLSIGLYLVFYLRQHDGRWWLKTVMGLLLVLGLAGGGGLIWLFFSPGEQALHLPGEYLPGETALSAANPAEYGRYSVGYLTYGSGTDRRRPEYGQFADLITGTVNAGPYVYFSGWQEEVREWYWGFGMDHVPLNARVWYPIGDGPFPLVLVVHGNHNMTDYSEEGYAYLGELLASRGFIVASVDENFLNGSLYGKASNENDARAWLLLKHLEQWDRWNDQPTSEFYRQVDMDNIALIGHSRGGEAVALAAAFNRLPYYPENGNITWNFNYHIRSVIAIAPVDQQFRPAGHPSELVDVNYLVIQGSHDGDVSSFKGIQQYERVSFTDPNGDYFKAALYIYRANHGQFNSTWGDQDRSGMLGTLLNKGAFLSEEDQRRIATVYISAFLETTLHGAGEYLPLFRDYHLAGDWLPATNYISQYRDAGAHLIADFEEDADLTTAALEGANTFGVALASWKERALRFRNGDLKQNHVVRISWGGSSAYYSVTFSPDISQHWGIDAGDSLVFLLADERRPFSVSELIDFSIWLVDYNGQVARLRLSDILQVSPQLPATFTKIAAWDEEIFEEETELVFQSVRIPLSDFTAENANFSPDLIREIRFVFDQTSNGTISLDEIGFDLED